jgi:hypothetical protein
MKHLFVPYEIALILKEKSFDENCFAWYHCPTTYENEELNKYTLKIDRPPLNLFKNGGGTLLIAPLYQQVIDWFREKHNMNISITKDAFCDWYGSYEKNRNWYELSQSLKYYDCYNKAIEQALKLI